MAFAINTNVAALNSYRNLSNTQNDISKSLERLSTGLRINRAADDAAGLSISEGLRSQINGLNVAARNAQDGISVIQTAEGALTEVHSILQRMRDLAVQAGNDSNNAQARLAINAEAEELVAELDRIGQSTNFNGINLLDGSANLSFQIGADGDPSSQISVDLTAANVSGLSSALSVGAAGAEIAVVTPTAVADAMTFSFGPAGAGTVVTTADLGDAGDFKTVQDVADALNADTNFSASLYATVNKDNELVVSALNGEAVVGGNTAGTHAAAGTGLAVSVAGTGGALDFTNATGAAAAITAIDAQIENISSVRSNMGAMQNRMEHAIKSINIAAENLSASESRIRDTDMALEMANFTKQQIMSQAGTAMLAQANQINQGVLQLLG